MGQRKFRIGVVGANPNRGWFVSAHLPALRALPDRFEVSAVCTSRIETAKAAAELTGARLVFDDYQQLVNSDAVDLVVVTVKTKLHQEIVAAATAAGKDVLCEWPLGRDIAEAEALAAAAQTAGIRHLIGLQGRASPIINQARQLVAQGYVGRVLSTSIVASGFGWGAAIDPDQVYLFDDASGSSMLTIGAGHILDALCYICGEFREVNARLATQRLRAGVLNLPELARLRSFSALLEADGGTVTAAPKPGFVRASSWFTPTSPDQITISGVLEGGAVASVHVRGGQFRGTNLLWEINGEDGDLQITGAAGTVQICELKLKGGRGLTPGLRTLPWPAEYQSTRNSAPPGSAANIWREYKAYLGEDTPDSVQLADFSAALHRQRLLAAIKIAAETGCNQRLAQTKIA